MFGGQKIGRLIVCASFLVLTSQTAPAPLAAATRDFCSRLAVNIGIDRPTDPNGRTTWTATPLNFGQRFIFGGSTTMALNVAPVEPATMDDYLRLKEMCQPNKKGAVCKLVGPVDFHFIWKGNKTVTSMTAEERATVSVLGTKTKCQTEAP